MAGGVTPKQIYQALINAGASTVQAIGIMANMINESGLNPEATNPNDPGGSYGLVQQNGTQYAGLVSGNPSGDMNAQIRVVALNGGFQDASGQTPAEAAGNFASKYERCVGCQPGGAQYNGRVANAATVAGWVSSGNWPASAGAASAGASSSQGAPGGPDCAFSVGGQHLGIFFGRGPSLPSACLIRKTEVRAFLGAMILVGGGLVVLPGLIIVLVYGFRASGAARVVTQVASVTPAGRAARTTAGRRGPGRRAAGTSRPAPRPAPQATATAGQAQ